MNTNHSRSAFKTELEICIQNRSPYQTYEDVHLLTLSKPQLRLVQLHGAVMHLREYLHMESKTPNEGCSIVCVCFDYCHPRLDGYHLVELQQALKLITSELRQSFPSFAHLYTAAVLG